jgi:hypothetical protein
VDLDKHEPPAGPQRRGGAAHPGADVLDPTDRPDRGVSHVEAAVQAVGQRRGVGLHPLDLDAAALGEVRGLGQRGAREVHARQARAAARERDRVEPDVALNVHDVATAKVGSGLGDGGRLGRPQVAAAGDQALRVIDRVLAVNGGQGVPARAVDLESVVANRPMLRGTRSSSESAVR